MSIERELLKRVISGDDDGDFFISHRLYKDIETFLAQPEQEPISDDYTKLKEDYKYYISQKSQKREPLSETAVCEILIKKEWRGFVDLVRIIEKAHGIGGGNE